MSLPGRIRHRIAISAALVAAFSGSAALAALPIDLEVAMEGGVPITAPQEWARLLGQMDLGTVRLRSAQAEDQPSVTKVDRTGGIRLRVTAVLTRRNELILPKARFRAGDRAKLRKYFADLPIDFAEGDDPRGRFNLTEKQFNAVHADLSKVVDFSTQGKTALEILKQLEAKFSTPIELLPATQTLLADHPLALELRDMTAGTTLAIALRREGLALLPEKPRGQPLHMRVIRFNPEIDTWPTGWKSEASPRVVAPKMFESLTIEIEGYTLARALKALKPRMGIPVIFDQWVLQKRDIHPDKIQVKLARGKIYLKKCVDRILSQAHLAGDLRVDELGQPFYWVTQYGKSSPRVRN